MNRLTNKKSLDIDHLESYIQTIMKQWDIPGLSLAIVKEGKPVVVKGYGTKEADKDLPVDEQTLFPINGGTRLITASALALLVAEGKLSWHDRLTDVLPEFKTGSELINQEATVIDALAMRIGFPMERLASLPYPSLSRKELLNKLQHINRPDGFRNGQSAGFFLAIAAGEIIPAVTGISWDDFVQERLFKPLDMNHSITGPHLLHTRDNVATMHDTVNGQRVSIAPTMTHNVGPAISVYSCATDMAKWLQFQLDNGTVDNSNQVRIPQAQVDVMRQIHMAKPIGLKGCVAELSGCGLGLLVLTSHTGHRVYSIGGDIEGGEAFHSFVPELNLGIAVMVNAHVSIPQRLIPWIIDRYRGAPETDWTATIADYQQLTTKRKQAVDEYRERLTNPSQPPSLPLDTYQGIYHHPYLGDFAIRQDGGALVYTFGEMWEGELPHANHNTFFVEPMEPIFHRFRLRGPLRFNLSVEGGVESLTIEEGVFVKCKA